MQAAYAYAEDGNGDPPIELEMAWRIHDVGAEAVLGINAPARLIRRVTLSHAIYCAYCSRRDYRDQKDTENWAEWAKKYPDQNRLLTSIRPDDG